MTSNPLIDKYNELYGKKEEPQPQKTYIADKLKELRDTSTIPVSNFTSYDYTMGNDNFLQIAELIKNKEARVNSFSTTTSNMLTRTIEFSVEVWM